jgi:hypothetical protein
MGKGLSMEKGEERRWKKYGKTVAKWRQKSGRCQKSGAFVYYDSPFGS